MSDFSRGKNSSGQDSVRMMKRSNSGFVSAEKDPIVTLLTEQNLPFLSAAASVPLPSVDCKVKVPTVSNCEMWSLDQLYCLRSELIQLKAFIDKKEEQINATYANATHQIQNSFVEKQMDREIRRIRVKFDTKSSQKVEKEIRADGGLQANVKSTDRKLLSSKNHSKNKGAGIDPNEPKEITADTIWETTERFYKPIKSANYFDRYLTLSKPVYDLAKMQEPLGVHYSITFPKTPQYLSDPLKSKLKMPPPPFSSGESSDGNTHLHRRLMSALLNIADEDDMSSDSEFALNEERSDNEEPRKQNKFTANSLKKCEELCAPLASRIGISKYGQLGFEVRLQMELEFVGITGKGKTVLEMNYPIMHYLNEAVMQQRLASENANHWRRIMERYIVQGQKTFQENVKKHNNWSSALSLYLQQEEILKQAKKNKSKSKSKDHKKNTAFSSSTASTPTSDDD